MSDWYGNPYQRDTNDNYYLIFIFFMKKFGIIFLVIFLWFLSSCGKKEELIITKNYKTVKVMSGTLNETQNFIGSIEWVEEVYLGAKMGGKIIWLYSEEWQRVSAGTTLWQLDGEESKVGIQTANNIALSLESLSLSTADMFDEQIKALEQKLEQSKTSISIAESSILVAEAGQQGSTKWLSDVKDIASSQLETVTAQLEQATVGIETAESSYDNSLETLDQKENDIYSNSKIAVNQITNFSTSIFDNLDLVLGITEKNKDKNNSFESFLWGNKVETKEKTTTLLRSFQEKLKTLKEKNTLLKSESASKEEIYATLVWINSDIYPSLKEILQSSYDMFNESIASEGTLSETSLTNYKNQVLQFQNNLDSIVLSVSATTELGIQWAINNIQNFKKNKTMQLDLLKKQIELAQKNKETLEKTYKNYEAIRSWQISEGETRNTIAQEQKSMAEKQKQIAEQQLKELEASIEGMKKQKQAKLDELSTKKAEVGGNKMTSIVYLDNTKIISSLNGVVTKKFWEVGQVVWAGVPLYVVANDDNLKLKVSVPEESLKNIVLGEVVKISLEEQKKEVSGKVAKILPTIDAITKTWIVEIEIQNKEHTIKIGSYAKAYFTHITPENLKKELGILIPNSSIIADLWVPWVYVIQNNIAQFKNIEIIETGKEKTQVKWLKPWEIVITEGKENISDGEKLK